MRQAAASALSCRSTFGTGKFNVPASIPLRVATIAPSIYLTCVSASRDDHFVDSQNCSEGCGPSYVFQHSDGFAFFSAGAGLVALNLYWNEAPDPSPKGSTGDNVASSFPPTQPGYTFVRVEGYIYDPALPQPPGTLPLKVR